MALDPERRTALRGAKLRALVADATAGTVFGEVDGDHLFDGTRLWTLASEDEPAIALGAALLRASRHGDATPMTVCFDDPLEAALAARRVTALEPSPEVRLIDGRTLVEVDAAGGPEPVMDISPTGFADRFDDLCRGVGVDPVLEHGTWRGEVLGLEVARAVELSTTEPSVEVGVGRFDREAGVMMRGNRSDAEVLAAAADLVRAQRRPGAGAHPLVCSVGVDPRLVPAVAELVLRELPDRVLVVLPTRDVLAPVERAVARLRVPTTVVGVACSWDA